ncbi:gag-protease polyprotein, partial [Trifolium medium]|nr:gag-protease polyprotein [Trifolium medium]
NAYEGPDMSDVKTSLVVPQLEEAHQKFKALEDRLSMMEGNNDPIDFASMCLVPDLVLPPKFKVPDFEKYKGLNCPKNHLIMYSRKMASFANDDKLMMHCFQDSLTGASLNWYMQLEASRVRSWRDLANAFLKQYQYNIDMAPSRTQLQNMSQKEGELFKVYAQRWRELAAQVRPPLSETELTDMFTNTLQGAYYEKMVGSVSSGFADLVKIGERIEVGLKSGKIQAAGGNQNNVKKPASGFTRKKEGEANAIAAKNNRSYPAAPAQVPYFPFPYMA